MEVKGETLISVPTADVPKIIEMIEEKGCKVKEVSLSDRKKILQTENPDPAFTMIIVSHLLPIKEVMEGIYLKRVI